MKRALEKAASGPSGMLIYHPTREFTFGKLFGIEFATELLQAILVVVLLTQTRIESFSGRVGFALIAGILAAVTTNIPSWNWYGFPSSDTAAYMSIEIIGFLCVGLVAGLLLKNRSPASATG
jgi:pheromone shutdown protein TraB